VTEDDRPVIDVERIVAEIRERVAARGDEAVELTTLPLDIPPPDAPVRFRPDRAYSTKPLVGRPLTLVKQALLRLLVHVFDDLAAQTSAAIEADRAAARATEARLLGRIEEIEGTLDHLQLGPRLARLERARRTVATPAAPVVTSPGPGGAPPAADAGFDYLAFEARFRGSEEAIRDRQRAYLDLLGSRRRVVDLGCGRGELLELLRDAGVDAYGVELDGDFGYHHEGFFAGIAYGVLFPLSALDHPTDDPSGGSGPGFGYGDNDGDAEAAQTIQTRLMLQF
jgi:hypothetical protein